MEFTAALIALATLAAGLLAGWALGRGSAAACRVELARVETELAHERSLARRRVAEIEADERRLREAFAAASAEALRHNSEQFLALAESRLAETRAAVGGDLRLRQQAIETLLTPMRETLARVEGQIRDVEKERVGAQEALLAQVETMRASSEALRGETAQLVTALRAPQQRGRWGELQLQRVVEAAGMVEHCDFVQQPTVTTADGSYRPDLVVQLAGGKHIVVDAKVAFSGYLEAMEARDEQTRRDRLKAHARHLRGHVDSLAAKAYWQQFDPAPEFVVCFVPADVFLHAALEQEPALLEYAFGRNVVVATPSTLIALLRTVAYSWRQEALTRNAQQVHQLARELYRRLATWSDHLDGVGKALNTAVTHYNAAVGSWESRVLVSARKLEELQVVEAALEPPRQVETHPRSVRGSAGD